MREWISLPRVEGRASRQAHADLPEGTYERELGREGFLWAGDPHVPSPSSDGMVRVGRPFAPTSL